MLCDFIKWEPFYWIWTNFIATEAVFFYLSYSHLSSLCYLLEVRNISVRGSAYDLEFNLNNWKNIYQNNNVHH